MVGGKLPREGQITERDWREGASIKVTLRSLTSSPTAPDPPPRRHPLPRAAKPGPWNLLPRYEAAFRLRDGPSPPLPLPLHLHLHLRPSFLPLACSQRVECRRCRWERPRSYYSWRKLTFLGEITFARYILFRPRHRRAGEQQPLPRSVAARHRYARPCASFFLPCPLSASGKSATNVDG